MLISDMTNEELCALTVAIMDDNGHEIVNPKPNKIRIQGQKPDLETRIKNILQLEIKRRSIAEELNAPETDPEDFEIPDEDSEPKGNYEIMEEERPIDPVESDTPPGETSGSEETEEPESQAANTVEDSESPDGSDKTSGNEV